MRHCFTAIGWNEIEPTWRRSAAAGWVNCTCWICLKNSLERLFSISTRKTRATKVVVDVRNNNGGFVNVYAVDVLARQSYLTMTTRGLPSAPACTLLGQRVLEHPTILVTNEASLSDAEDFTEGYRTLDPERWSVSRLRDWIIYTSNCFSRRWIKPAHPVHPRAGPRRRGHGTSPAPRGYRGGPSVWRNLRGGKDSQLDAAVSY